MFNMSPYVSIAVRTLHLTPLPITTEHNDDAEVVTVFSPTSSYWSRRTTSGTVPLGAGAHCLIADRGGNGGKDSLFNMYIKKKREV